MKIMLDKGSKMPTRAHPWDAGLDLVDSLEETDRGDASFGSTGR